MEQFFTFGFFSFYCALVTLISLIDGEESRGLRSMKKELGRVGGAASYFVVHIAFPLVMGVVFLSHGSSTFNSSPPFSLPSVHRHLLKDLSSCRPRFRVVVHPTEVSASGEIALLLDRIDE